MNQTTVHKSGANDILKMSIQEILNDTDNQFPV